MTTMGFNTLRVGQFAISDGIFLVVIGIVVAQLLSGSRHGLAPARSRRTSQLVLVGSVVLLTAGTLSSFGSWNPGASLLIAVRVGYLTLVWFWILRAVTPTRVALDTLLRGWRTGVVIVATAALLDHFGLIGISAENAEGRQTAFFGHPNDLAGFLVAALPLFILGLPGGPEDTDRRGLVSRFAVIGLLVYTLSNTGSITGMVSAAVAAAATLGLMALFPSGGRRRRRRNPLAYMVMAVAVILALGYLTTLDLAVFERYERYESGDAYLTGSAGTRGQLNQAVIGSFDQWLITGVGFDSESVFATGFFDERLSGGIHNMYLKVLLEAGLPAMLGLVMIIGATLRAAILLMINTRRTALHPVAISLTASTIGACTFANFGPILYQRFFWVPMALIWCLWAIRREELRVHLDADAPATG